MRRTLAIVLLATGTVLGFGAGFAHLYGYGPCGHHRHGFYGHGFYGHDCGDRERPTPPAAP